MPRWPLSLSLVAACAVDLRDDTPAGAAASTPREAAPTRPSPEAGADDHELPVVRLDVPAADETTTAAGDPNCASFTDTGSVIKRPADIIFVVDNSPSMIEETDAVQAQLNAFSQQIVDAGIDIRVLLLTAY